jgi:hypothetical protein
MLTPNPAFRARPFLVRPGWYGLGQTTSTGAAPPSLPSTASPRASSGAATQTCVMGIGPRAPWEIFCPSPAALAAQATQTVDPAAATGVAALLLLFLLANSSGGW